MPDVLALMPRPERNRMRSLQSALKEYQFNRLGRGLSELTERQQQVVCLVARSHTYREIAAEMKISEGCVSGHLRHVKRKLGFSDPAALARYAIRKRLISAYD